MLIIVYYVLCNIYRITYDRNMLRLIIRKYTTHTHTYIHTYIHTYLIF